MKDSPSPVLHRVIKPPCGKSCPDRKVGCHSSCRAFAEFQRKLKEEKDKAWDASAGEFFTGEYQINASRRRKKGWRKYK